MINKETIKVILTSCLLFFMCYLGRLHNDYSNSLSEWVYPHYDVLNDKFDITPKETFSEPYMWFFKTVFDKIAPLILALIFIVSPDFKKWGVNLMWLWVFYFTLLSLNYVLTYDSLNIMVCLNRILMITQMVYCVDFYQSSKKII